MIILIFILLILLSLILFLHMKNVAKENNVKYEIIYFPNFPRSFKEIALFFISDIHKRIVADVIIEEVKDVADLVIIGGDLLEKGVSLDQVRGNIRKLRKIGPVYFVWGNNDYEVDRQKLIALLQEEEVNIISNTAISFKSDQGEKWSLMGIEDFSLKHDDLEAALSHAVGEHFKILISHNPKIIKEIKQQDHISLVLSGHTHGGQIRFLGFGPYEIGRTKLINQTTLLVSNGYGTTSIPLRLGAKPETHVIKLKHLEDK